MSRRIHKKFQVKCVARFLANASVYLRKKATLSTCPKALRRWILLTVFIGGKLLVLLFCLRIFTGRRSH